MKNNQPSNKLSFVSSITLAAAVALACQATIASAAKVDSSVENPAPIMASQPLSPTQPKTLGQQKPPRIQLAILLDTSNSMDGLIDQTRNQLWQVVNEFSTARQNGVTPVLEIALFEFGNDNNAASSGYVRKISGFTRELDAVSQGLFSLTTNGGSEFCGYAIDSAVSQLQWSRASNDIRTIFIAGNESFAQGPVDYRDALELASQNGISINTIHAGNHQAGIKDGWQNGALLAGGDYMSIDADQQIAHIVAPQDKKLAELNARLNATYVPYGSNGAAKAERQMEQDELSSGISSGLLAKRAKSKSTAFYRNSDWDLVDALNEGEIAAEEVEKMEAENLPQPMKDLSSKEKLEYVQQKAAERLQIKQQISELGRQRDAYVAAKKAEQVAAAPSMSDALTQAVKKQARQKNFIFEQ